MNVYRFYLQASYSRGQETIAFLWFQRMSVLTIVDNSTNLTVFAKGAPETLANLCVKESIPKDFKKKLTIFAKEGYRVIAVATKELPSNINNRNVSLHCYDLHEQLYGEIKSFPPEYGIEKPHMLTAIYIAPFVCLIFKLYSGHHCFTTQTILTVFYKLFSF